ncbi:MAG: hypothetical protein AAGN64_02815 [Bacteroidota bacterium]
MAAPDRNQLPELVRQRIEDADLFAGWQVEPLTLDIEEFLRTRLKSQRGAVLTSYAGQRATRRGSESASGRDVIIDVVVLARRLEGPTGAQAAITAIDTLLTDAQLIETDNGQPVRKWLVRFLSDEFLDEADRISQHLVRFRLQLLN